MQESRRQTIYETTSRFFDSQKLYIKTAQNAKLMAKVRTEVNHSPTEMTIQQSSALSRAPPVNYH